MTLNNIKDKIAKLLSTAANEGSTQGEKNNAMMAAQIMMAKHDLESDDCVHAEKQFDDLAASFTGKRPARWELHLSGFIKVVYGVPVYRAGNTIHFYGRREKIEMAVEMFAELRSTIVSLAKKKYNSWAKKEGAVYAEGFVAGLMASYRETLQIRKSTEEGNALVVQAAAIVRKDAFEAQNWLAKDGIRLKKTSQSSGPTGSQEAYSQGITDGKQTNLSSYNGTLKLT